MNGGYWGTQRIYWKLQQGYKSCCQKVSLHYCHYFIRGPLFWKTKHTALDKAALLSASDSKFFPNAVRPTHQSAFPFLQVMTRAALHPLRLECQNCSGILGSIFNFKRFLAEEIIQVVYSPGVAMTCLYCIKKLSFFLTTLLLFFFKKQYKFKSVLYWSIWEVIHISFKVQGV